MSSLSARDRFTQIASSVVSTDPLSAVDRAIPRRLPNDLYAACVTREVPSSLPPTSSSLEEETVVLPIHDVNSLPQTGPQQLLVRRSSIRANSE